MKNLYLFLTVCLFTSAIKAQIPDEYQELYQFVEDKLVFIDSTITANWDGEKYCTSYCTNLLPASSNKGEHLLGQLPELYAVKGNLNAIDSLGVECIDLTIQYPILVNSFPRSDEYLEYYKQVVQEIRNRGKKLLIGCQSTFRDSVFGQLDVSEFYIGLTTERYKTEKAQMLQTIIDSLQPNYITLEMEPSTQEMNLGLDFSVDSVMDYIDYFMNHVEFNDALVGSGSGTWDSMDFIDTIARRADIDYIDYHIYPVNLDFFVDKVFKIDSLAKLYDKKLIIGECWLHKVTDDEFSELSYLDVFSRDVFSFWIPLDSLFIESIVKLSHYSKIEVTSLFWANFFFAYLDYDEELGNMSPGELYDTVFKAATPNIISITFSPIGELYEYLIEDACDTSSFVSQTNFEKEKVRIYPNPGQDLFYIEYENASESPYSILLYNIAGQQVVKKEDINSIKLMLKTDDLKSGMYFLQIKDNRSIIAIEKIVIM